MGVLGDFLSNGQDRRRWIEEKGQDAADALQYYLGPGVNVNALATIADAFNPVGDMTRAGTAARGVVRPGASVSERVGSLGNVATDMASVLAPVAGAAYADDAARGLTEALANWSMPADDAVGRFAADEFGGMKLYRGTNDSGERITGGIGEGYLFGSPYEDVARLYGDNISQFELMDNARVLREGTPEFAQLTGRKRGELLRTMRPGESLKTAADDAIAKARDAGYDAVEFTSMRDMGVAVLNPSAVKTNLPPAEARGAEVLDLLKSGRASEVTDDMLDLGDPVLNAQLSEYLYRSGFYGGGR